MRLKKRLPCWEIILFVEMRNIELATQLNEYCHYRGPWEVKQNALQGRAEKSHSDNSSNIGNIYRDNVTDNIFVDCPFLYSFVVVFCLIGPNALGMFIF